MIAMVFTGGTISMRVDAVAGGAIPALQGRDILMSARGIHDVALITDGRFSGASYGFVAGHVSPEAAAGGPIGLILSSAFSAIVVYAQELIPGKVGMVAGFVFGFAFGVGAIGAALLGALADVYDILFVFNICAFLPVLGFLTIFLPRRSEMRRPQEASA